MRGAHQAPGGGLQLRLEAGHALLRLAGRRALRLQRLAGLLQALLRAIGARLRRRRRLLRPFGLLLCLSRHSLSIRALLHHWHVQCGSVCCFACRAAWVWRDVCQVVRHHPKIRLLPPA